jgi:hypothetical protein
MKRMICLMSVCLLLIGAFLAAPYNAGADDQAASAKKPPTPEEMKQIMDATFGAMIPMMARMTEVIVETLLMEAEKPETATRLAVFKKNLYDALIKQGFSKQQALQIILNTSVPSVTPAMK